MLHGLNCPIETSRSLEFELGEQDVIRVDVLI